MSATQKILAAKARNSLFSTTTDRDSPNSSDDANTMQQGLPANIDYRQPFDEAPRLTPTEVTLEMQLDGQDVHHKTFPLSSVARELFYEKITSQTVFRKLDFTNELKFSKSDSDRVKYALQATGEAAPFKCKNCTKGGIFQTCVVSPLYGTDTAPFACVSCYLRRKATTCDHNPLCGAPVLNSRLQRNLASLKADIPLAYRVKATPPPPTLVTADQVRTLQAHGLDVVVAGTSPNFAPPRSRRQAAARCNEAMQLIRRQYEDRLRREKNQDSEENVTGSLPATDVQVMTPPDSLADQASPTCEDSSSEAPPRSRKRPSEGQSGQPQAKTARKTIPASHRVSATGITYATKAPACYDHVQSLVNCSSCVEADSPTIHHQPLDIDCLIAEELPTSVPEAGGSVAFSSAQLQTGMPAANAPSLPMEKRDKPSFVTFSHSSGTEPIVRGEFRLPQTTGSEEAQAPSSSAIQPAQESADKLAFGSGSRHAAEVHPISLLANAAFYPCTKTEEDHTDAYSVEKTKNKHGETKAQASVDNQNDIIFVKANSKKIDLSQEVPDRISIRAILDTPLSADLFLSFRQGSLLGSISSMRGGCSRIGTLERSIRQHANSLIKAGNSWSVQLFHCSNQPFCMSPIEHEILRGNGWFNDIIISSYFHLLHSAPSPPHQFLFSWIDSVLICDILRRRVDTHPLHSGWPSRLKELREARFILMPVHIDDHWVLLVVDKATFSFVLGDSVTTARNPIWAERLMDPVITFLRSHQAIPPVEESRPWSYLGNPLPSQRNSYDCGAFVCAGAKLIWESADITRKLNFNQKQVTAFRRHMLAELALGRAVSFSPQPKVSQAARHYRETTGQRSDAPMPADPPIHLETSTVSHPTTPVTRKENVAINSGSFTVGAKRALNFTMTSPLVSSVFTRLALDPAAAGPVGKKQTFFCSSPLDEDKLSASPSPSKGRTGTKDAIVKQVLQPPRFLLGIVPH